MSLADEKVAQNPATKTLTLRDIAKLVALSVIFGGLLARMEFLSDDTRRIADEALSVARNNQTEFDAQTKELKQHVSLRIGQLRAEVIEPLTALVSDSAVLKSTVNDLKREVYMLRRSRHGEVDIDTDDPVFALPYTIHEDNGG